MAEPAPRTVPFWHLHRYTPWETIGEIETGVHGWQGKVLAEPIRTGSITLQKRVCVVCNKVQYRREAM
jgi:hypothetical protein